MNSSLRLTEPRRPLGARVRDIIRLNAYATLSAALLIFAGLLPAGSRSGLPWLALGGLVAALMLAGGDELMLAVGRRLRRAHLVPFALLNAASAAACLALAGRTSGFGRVVVVIAGVVFAGFALLETRAAKAL